MQMWMTATQLWTFKQIKIEWSRWSSFPCDDINLCQGVSMKKKYSYIYLGHRGSIPLLSNLDGSGIPCQWWWYQDTYTHYSCLRLGTVRVGHYREQGKPSRHGCKTGVEACEPLGEAWSERSPTSDSTGKPWPSHWNTGKLGECGCKASLKTCPTSV